MIYNTRFNPTVNGPLHLGHVYMLLVNEHEAHASGGKFGVRFDDTQRSWNHWQGSLKTNEFLKDMLLDIAWLGIRLDFVDRQSEMEHKVDRLLDVQFGYQPDREAWSCDNGSEVVGAQHHFYPYTDRLTSEKVIEDCMEGVTWLIRGMDLITEDCLYKHYCNKFLIAVPRMTYIPRLMFDGDTVSKTTGKYKVSDFRDAGMSPEELRVRLAVDCLDGMGWRVEYIKPLPVLGEWAKEVLSANR